MTDPPPPLPPTNLLEGLGSFGAHLLDEATLRGRVGRWYETHDGLRSSGKTQSEYEQFIFPNDAPAWRRRAADDMFSCALRFLACCRLLGVPHALLAEPYARRVGQAVVDCRRVAEAYGALVTGEALDSYEPDEGDAMCSGVGNSVHVSCVTRAIWQPGPGLAPARVLHCVDGGQGRRGSMAIEGNVYRWEPGAIRNVDPQDWRSLDRPGARRPLVWIIDLWQLVVGAGLLDDA